MSPDDPAFKTYVSEFPCSGFFSPIDNLDADGNFVLNQVKAGQAVPVKFNLGGDRGLDILEAGYPKTDVIPCDPNAEIDGIEPTQTAGRSTYDPQSQQYNCVWKTEKTWTGCRRLVVELIDYTVHRASFKFSK